MDFWEDDLDQLGEALGMDAGVRDAGCGSATLLGQLLGSGVCRPRALRSVFPLIPAKQTHARGQRETRVPVPSNPLLPGTLPGCRLHALGSQNNGRVWVERTFKAHLVLLLP